MSDLISIYVVALLFYLFDSIRRTGLQAVIFKPNWRGASYRARFPAIYPSNGDWGWGALNLIRPWNAQFLTDPPEIRFSPDGLLCGRLDDASRLRSLPWSAVTTIQSDDDGLTVNGQQIPCASPRFWCDALTRVHKARPDAKEAECLHLLKSSFDLQAATQTLSRFRIAAAPFRWLTGSLLATIVVVFPLLALSLTEGKAVLAFAALLFSQSICIAVFFHRAHHAVYQRSARFVAWKMALYPIAAVRAIDELARNLFASHHALIVAALLCAESSRAAVARRSLRDALFPVNANSDDELGVAILNWHSTRTGEFLEQRIAPMKLSREALWPKPERHHSSITYCPRCLSQFNLASGECPDCSAVRLVAFTKESS